MIDDEEKAAWSAAEGTKIGDGSIETLMLSWRTRCLSAEKKLQNCLAELAQVRLIAREALTELGRTHPLI